MDQNHEQNYRSSNTGELEAVSGHLETNPRAVLQQCEQIGSTAGLNQIHSGVVGELFLTRKLTRGVQTDPEPLDHWILFNSHLSKVVCEYACRPNQLKTCWLINCVSVMWGFFSVYIDVLTRLYRTSPMSPFFYSFKKNS